MTAEDAADGQIEALEGTMFANGLNSIVTASGREAAHGRREGRDALLVKLDGKNENPP